MSKHASRSYKLNTTTGTVTVTDHELRRRFLPLRLARADVELVMVGEASKRNTSLTSTRATMREVVVSLVLLDGTVKRLRSSRLSVAEILAAFKLRGWPVASDL